MTVVSAYLDDVEVAFLLSSVVLSFQIRECAVDQDGEMLPVCPPLGVPLAVGGMPQVTSGRSSR